MSLGRIVLFTEYHGEMKVTLQHETSIHLFLSVADNSKVSKLFLKLREIMLIKLNFNFQIFSTNVFIVNGGINKINERNEKVILKQELLSDYNSDYIGI